MSLVQRVIDAVGLSRASVFSVIAGINASGGSQLVGVNPDGSLNVVLSGVSAFQPSVNTVGTGAPGSLESLATVGILGTTLVTVYDAGRDILGDWLLVASTAASSNDGDGNPAVQRPIDFNASTNAKVWFRKR